MKISKTLRLTLVLAIVGMSLGYFLRIKILMAASMLEFKLLSQDPKSTQSSCASTFAYHRGYSNKGAYPENSRISLSRAVANGVKAIEVDVSIDGAGKIFVGHDLKTLDFPLSSFIEEYQNQFDTLLTDIKEVESGSPDVQHLSSIDEKFGQVIYLGRNCPLLYELSKLGKDVSCEALGVLGHEVLGWKWWSVNHRVIGERYLSLLERFPKNLITWTFKDESHALGHCSKQSKIMLIEQ